MADVGHGRDFDPLLPARQHDLKGRLIAGANVLLSGWALSRCRVPAVTGTSPGCPFRVRPLSASKVSGRRGLDLDQCEALSLPHPHLRRMFAVHRD